MVACGSSSSPVKTAEPLPSRVPASPAATPSRSLPPPLATLTEVPSTPARISATPAPVATAQATPDPVAAMPQVLPIRTLPDTPEQRRATDLVAGEPGVYGFVVLEADGTVVASLNSTTPFITASTYKLVLMADMYRRIESGSLDADETILLDESMFDEAGDMYFSYDDLGSAFPLQEYLFAVGAYSSNASARTLLTLTTPDELRATAVRIGMEQTYLFTDPTHLSFWPPKPGVDASAGDVALAQSYLEDAAAEGPVNVTTPLDMARYQLALANGTLISPWVSEQIADILEQQLIRDRIPFYLEDIRVLNKPGNLEDAVNDVGVIYLPEGTRAIAMLSQAVPDTAVATLLEQRLALIATGSSEIPPIMDDDLVEQEPQIVDDGE